MNTPTFQPGSTVKQGVVRSVTQLGERLHVLQLEADARVIGAAGPGRYLMLTVGEGVDPYLPRPYWVRRSSDSRLQLLVQAAGRGSRWLAGRNPGDALEFFGPLGAELRLPPRTSRLLLFGDVRGLAALLALADAALAQGLEVALVLDGERLPALPGLLPPAVEVLQRLDAEAIRWADALYCAGDSAVLQRAQAVLRASSSQLPACGLLHAPLACGVGACYGCVVHTRSGQRLSCVDGPAFPLRELIWT